MVPERYMSWISELAAARKASSEGGGFAKFVALAEEARGGGLNEAKGLVATIMSQPEDNGEGEAVLSILSEFEPELQVRAILEELPRLQAQHENEWAESLIETLLRFMARELIQGANASSPAVRSILRLLLTRLADRAQVRGANETIEAVRLAMDQIAS